MCVGKWALRDPHAIYIVQTRWVCVSRPDLWWRSLLPHLLLTCPSSSGKSTLTQWEWGEWCGARIPLSQYYLAPRYTSKHPDWWGAFDLTDHPKKGRPQCPLINIFFIYKEVQRNFLSEFASDSEEAREGFTTVFGYLHIGLCLQTDRDLGSKGWVRVWTLIWQYGNRYSSLYFIVSPTGTWGEILQCQAMTRMVTSTTNRANTIVLERHHTSGIGQQIERSMWIFFLEVCRTSF